MVQIAVVQRQGDGLHGVLNPTKGELALSDDEHLQAIAVEDVVVLLGTFAVAVYLCSPIMSVKIRQNYQCKRAKIVNKTIFLQLTLHISIIFCIFAAFF